LWINTYSFSSKYQYEALQAAIQHLFRISVETEQLLLLVPKGTALINPVKEIFAGPSKTANPNPEWDNFTLLSLGRGGSYGTKLRVRAARVEDHDDLAPILKANGLESAFEQDPYFLSNVIENQGEITMNFVGEVSD
jgi:hypothetical protein